MLLHDYTSEYQKLCSLLDKCNNYIKSLEELIETYSSGIIRYTNYLFTSNDSSKNTYTANKIVEETKKTYTSVKNINANSMDYLITIGKIVSCSFGNDFLKEKINVFSDLSYSSVKLVSDIIVLDLPGVQKDSYIKELMCVSHKLISTYYSLYQINEQLEQIEQNLLEPLPDGIDVSRIKTLELRSKKHSIGFSEFAKDLSLLSTFLEQLDIILCKKDNYTPIFTRKIETGSLRIVWSGGTFELTSISDIIRTIANAIKSFRLTGVEKRIEKEKADSLRLDNEAKALAIINTQIDKVMEILDLDPSNPEDKETIQRLCLPLIKYINNNPIGCIGDFNYNLSNEIQLLEDTYFKNDN